MSDQPGLLREGFQRVWNYQRVLWFIFVISFVLGHFGASPAVHKVEGNVNHSLQSKRIADAFDVSAFTELSSNPEVKLFEVGGTSVSLSIVFFIGYFFLTGGILEAYRSCRKLTTREFFEAMMRDLDVTPNTIVKWGLKKTHVTNITGGLSPLKIDGEFIRGINHRGSNAHPAETVWLQTFYMDKFHVTYEQYQTCVREGKCQPARPSEGLAR